MKQLNLDRIDKEWLRNNANKIAIASVLVFVFFIVIINMITVATSSGNNELQGTINAKEVSINSKIPGKIQEFYVVEGQNVKKGDLLVKISSDELEAKKDQLLAQIKQAEAGVKASENVIEMAEANYNLSQERIKQAQAGYNASISQRDMAQAVYNKAQNGARSQDVAKAESAYNLMSATYERAKILYDGGAISQQKFEEIEMQKSLYAETLSMAREGARSEDKAAATAQLSMAQSGVTASQAVLNQAIEASNAATAQVEQAQAGLIASQGRLEQAQAGLKEINVYLENTALTSPVDGTVTSINSDEGELISTGSSIATVTNTDTCWVNINLDENELSKLSEGQKVEVKLLAYPDEKQYGFVEVINKKPDFAVKKATNENGNFDIVSYSVKVSMENEKELLRPGMTAVISLNKVPVELPTETQADTNETTQETTKENTQETEVINEEVVVNDANEEKVDE